LVSVFAKVMPSFVSQALFGLALVLPGVLGGYVPRALAGTAKTCTNPQTSCQNTTAVTDLCCFNAPGGQLVQTQFWDTSPSTGTLHHVYIICPSSLLIFLGPSNSWTIHGLWPDHCDGTYDSNCDSSRAYTDITGILQSAGKTDLLSYMNTYW